MNERRIASTLPRRLAMTALLAVVGVAALQSGASAAASPTLSIYASNGWWAGSPISSAVNLNGGVNPNGFVGFNLFRPNDPNCSGGPLFTSIGRAHVLTPVTP